MQPRKILIVDDDPNVTRLLKMKLEAVEGITVEVCNTASRAFEQTKSFQPDLIVCDIDMGEAWGGEVSRELSNDPLTATIPFVFLSSMVTPADMAGRTGGRRLISKKLLMPEIIQTIIKELPQP